MIEGMPRPRPPHLQREFTRHGKAVWYVRIGKGPRVRLRANFGTPEFDSEYQAAITGTPRPAKGAPAVGTVGWLRLPATAKPPHGRRSQRQPGGSERTFSGK